MTVRGPASLDTTPTVHALLAEKAATAVKVVVASGSVLVAGAGAFIYPNEKWNTDPDEVDLHHERLWQLRDSQIQRTIASRPSPQNFDLFTRDSVRRLDH